MKKLSPVICAAALLLTANFPAVAAAASPPVGSLMEVAAKTTAPKYPPLLAGMPHLLYGGDYNPEQWPEATWEEDARLMEQAGVNFVSVGIFSWSLLEPEPGRYDFAWLRRVLDILHRHGISVALATATASPPAWFTRAYPESRPVTAEGVVLDFGSRQHYCPNSPEYRACAARLVKQVVQELGAHPAVKLWHINNEVGCHVRECYCRHCDRAFQAWVQAKHTTLGQLNDAWGTAFWGQRYTDWAQILTPKKMTTHRNPAHWLDYKAFFQRQPGGGGAERDRRCPRGRQQAAGDDQHYGGLSLLQ